MDNKLECSFIPAFRKSIRPTVVLPLTEARTRHSHHEKQRGSRVKTIERRCRTWSAFLPWNLAAAVLLLAYFSLASVPASASSATRPTLFMVAEFENLTGHSQLNFLSGALCETLLTRLSMIEGRPLVVIERSQMRRAIGELKMSSNDLFDKESAVRLGHFLMANKIVVGSYQAFEEVLKISARVVDVETLRIELAVEESGPFLPAANLFELEDKLAKSLVQKLSFAGLDSRQPYSTNSMISLHCLENARKSAMSRTSQGYKNSVATLTSALRREPAFVEAWMQLARVYSDWAYLNYQEDRDEYEGYYQESNRAVQRALKLDPNCFEARLVLADNHRRQGRYDAALDLAASLQAEGPSNPTLLHIIARSHEKSDHAKEVSLLRDAVETYPSNDILLASLANALFRSRRFEEARHYYQRAIRYNPDSVVVYANLGYACQAIGLYAEASEHYLHAFESDPSSSSYLQGLVYNLLQQERHSDTLDYIRQYFEYVTSDKPDNVAVVKELLGRILEAMMEQVEFDFDSEVVKRRYYPTLDETVSLLEQFPEVTHLVMEGHTDSTGTESYNLDLSRRRVKAVRKILVSKGLDRDRIEAVGKGEAFPISSNEQEIGRSRNRRVVFVLTVAPSDYLGLLRELETARKKIEEQLSKDDLQRRNQGQDIQRLVKIEKKRKMLLEAIERGEILDQQVLADIRSVLTVSTSTGFQGIRSYSIPMGRW